MLENEIGNLGEAAADDRIVRRQFDIALSENIADVSRLRWHALIVAPTPPERMDGKCPCDRDVSPLRMPVPRERVHGAITGTKSRGLAPNAVAYSVLGQYQPKLLPFRPPQAIRLPACAHLLTRNFTALQ
jgi:hypothetical protein